MEHEEWREQFVADPAVGSISIVSTRFRTFGAGVPDSAPETELVDGWVVMRGFDRIVDPLFIRANAETDHILTIAERTVPLVPGQYEFTVAPACRRRGADHAVTITRHFIER